MKVIEAILKYIMFLVVVAALAAVLTAAFWIMILCILGIQAQFYALFFFCFLFIITWVLMQHFKSAV